MKSEWQRQTLGDVCLFENGDRGENYPSKSVQTSHGVPFINAGHLTDEGIDLESMNFIPRERFDLLSNGKIRRGDILFCLRGSLGKFSSVGGLSEGAIASSLVILRPKKSVLDRYILAYLQSDLCADMIEHFRNGAAQPNLSVQSLAKFSIPVPLLPEQQRIVGILDAAFERIATAKANCEKNLQNARALFESHLNAVFTQRGKGWIEKTLKDVCEKITDGTHQTPRYFGQGVVFLSSRNVAGGTIDWDRIKYIDEKQHIEMRKRVAPRLNDILLAKNGTTGVAAIVDRDVVFDIYVETVEKPFFDSPLWPVSFDWRRFFVFRV